MNQHSPDFRRAASRLLASLLVATAAPTLHAGIEFVTLPERDGVQLTIYREVDLTLVRERRTITFKKGENRLEFSWAGTQIDPTSLEILPTGESRGFRVLDSSYPPRVSKTLVWTVEDDRGGPRPVEIAYFTSGVSWSAGYHVVAGEDGRTMRLEGDVTISNQSGEDFEEAAVRLVVGHVNLVESISALANRNEARETSARAFAAPPMPSAPRGMAMMKSRRNAFAEADGGAGLGADELSAAKEIMKQGLADQYLFSIPGTETLKNGWRVRMPSLRAEEVPFELVSKFREDMYGSQVRSFFRIQNAEASKLGKEPLPEGDVQVFRRLPAGRLAWVGRSQTKYIPIGEKVELDLGPDPEVEVRVKTMVEATENYEFDSESDIRGWDEVREYSVELRNARPYPVGLEVWRSAPADQWAVQTGTSFERVDLRTMKVVQKLAPGAASSFDYRITWGSGTRAGLKR